MLVKKNQRPILIINLVALILFSVLFIFRQNYEFLMYVGVIIFFLFLIIGTNKQLNYPNDLLWGLTIWSLMHMTGGGVYIGDLKVYELIIFPIVGEPYQIFRYDQLVHILGFAVATLAMWHVLKPNLRPDRHGWASVLIVILMAGLGIGALNEIIEFIATVIIPETGVGGYENTSLDLVADLLGAILALGYIKIKK